jgi:hypothetical protein
MRVCLFVVLKAKNREVTNCMIRWIVIDVVNLNGAGRFSTNAARAVMVEHDLCGGGGGYRRAGLRHGSVHPAVNAAASATINMF